MSKYFKSAVYMKPEIYESWCEINKDKDFIFDSNPYVYFISDENKLSLISNPITGIKGINLILIQASLFKSVTLINFVKRWRYFYPSEIIIIYFDKEIEDNLLLLKKLNDMNCKFMLKADDWKGFDNLNFSSIDQLNSIDLLMKKRKSRKKLHNDYQSY